MPNRYNAASRVYAIFDAARRQDGHSEIAEAWRVAFELPDIKPPHLYYAVSAQLQKLHGEVSLVQSQLQATHYSAELYGGVVSTLFSVLDPANLKEKWQPLGAHITAGKTLELLAVFVESLPAEADPIPAEELEDMLEHLWEARAGIKDSDLSPDAKQFLRRQIDIAIQAVLDYRIIGGRAWTGSFGEVYADLLANAELVKEQGDNPEFWSRLTPVYKVWVRARDFYPNVEAVFGYLDVATRFAAFGIVIQKLLTG